MNPTKNRAGSDVLRIFVSRSPGAIITKKVFIIKKVYYFLTLCGLACTCA